MCSLLGTQAAPCTQLQPNWMIPPEVSSLAPGETLGSPKGIYCAKWRVLDALAELRCVWCLCVRQGRRGDWGGPAREARGLGVKAVPHWALSAFRGRSVHPWELHLGVLGGGGRAGVFGSGGPQSPGNPVGTVVREESFGRVGRSRWGWGGGRRARGWAWPPRLLRNGGPRPASVSGPGCPALRSMALPAKRNSDFPQLPSGSVSDPEPTGGGPGWWGNTVALPCSPRLLRAQPGLWYVHKCQETSSRGGATVNLSALPGQLNPHAAAAEPVLWSPGATTTEAPAP